MGTEAAPASAQDQPRWSQSQALSTAEGFPTLRICTFESTNDSRR